MFKEPTELEAEESVVVEDEEEPFEIEEEANLLCKICGNKITNYKYVIEVKGKYKHICVNPHGILFEIGCFSKVFNCHGTGVSTYEFTWFPGFAWRILLCNSCLTHLGWEYSGKDMGVFYGLILQNLIEGGV